MATRRFWRGSRPALVLVATIALVLTGAASSAEHPHGFGVRVFRFVDHTRTIALPGGRRVARTVVTIVRYPSAGGPHPLIVFGHGYTLTPASYATLLDAWASAGYVVAAPIFPLENAHAPGGPNESDLVTQPADMRLVITRLLALDALPGDILHDRIDPHLIAIAGHSGRRGDSACRRLRQPLSRSAGPCGGHSLRRRDDRDGRVSPGRSAPSRDAGNS